MSQLPSRAQIAQRMRQELIREIDHEILVERLLSDERYARDVLLVCDALAAGDLAALAALFREATQAEQAHVQAPSAAPAAAPPPGHAHQSNDWGNDTSGFGVTHPPAIEPELPDGPQRRADDDRPTERRRGWIKPWRRD